MLIYRSLLINPANAAGMKVPENPDNFDPEEFPHFQVFCYMQLGKPMQCNAPWENAKVIAAVHEAEIKLVTPAQLRKRGFV